jgi:phenylacetate-CoA ligase
MVRRAAIGRAQVRLLGSETDAHLLRDRVAGMRPPYFVWAYASYAVRLARELLAEQVVLPTAPRVVVAVAETMAAPTADLVARAFRCPVVRHYSCREVPRIAQTCPDRHDRFHVNSERAIVRIVRPDGRAAAPGERGRLLVTDLGNEVMPFINYDLGDTGVAAAPCDCGRGLPTFGAIEGRTSETIALGDGRVVSAATLQEFLLWRCAALAHVAEYQAVQRERGVVELRVVPAAAFSDEFARRVAAHSGELLGPDTECRVVVVEHIERPPSGKQMTVRSELR